MFWIFVTAALSIEGRLVQEDDVLGQEDNLGQVDWWKWGTPAPTPACGKSYPGASKLMNGGRDCWSCCNQGFCDWCGAGVCCRRNHGPHTCDAIGGWDHHTCMLPIGEDDSSFEEQMARLAVSPYDVPEYYEYREGELPKHGVAGWEYLVLQSKARKLYDLTDHDTLSVFRKKRTNECAIAIAGSNGLADWLSNINHVEGRFCGMDRVHSGFANIVRSWMQHKVLQSHWLPILKSKKCSGGIYVTGHSAGGAAVSLIAACVNRNYRRFGFQVNKVYTFGAPGVSKQVITNPLSSTGCFDGMRFFTLKQKSRLGVVLSRVDPVPVSVPFNHIAMTAAELKDIDGKLKLWHSPCNGTARPQEPYISWGVPYKKLHKGYYYVEGIRALFPAERK